MTRDSFDPFTLASPFDPLHHQAPPPPHPRRKPSATARPTEAGAGNRLAHLLPRAEPATAEARLQALEDEITILTARLDGLHASVTTRLDQHRDQRLEAVATLLDKRSRARR